MGPPTDLSMTPMQDVCTIQCVLWGSVIDNLDNPMKGLSKIAVKLHVIRCDLTRDQLIVQEASLLVNELFTF